MLVTAIIPAYNRPDMLERAIRSVLQQNYKKIELIVVNDCSSENLKNCKELISSQNIWLDLNKNSGPAVARNAAAKIAKGEFLAFLDSDDYWLEDKISEQVNFHQNNSRSKVSQCREIWYRNEKKVNPAKKHEMQAGKLFKDALNYCVISSSSVFINKDYYLDLGGYPENYRVCEDYALWLEVTLTEEIGLITSKHTVKYGGHEDQLSKSKPALDRYRLHALLCFLGSTNLNSEQEELTISAIKEKARILAIGAKKYKPENVQVYEDVMIISNNQELKKSIADLDLIIQREHQGGNNS